VTVAQDGFEAVDAVRHERFDVVLMDVQMPGLDGMEAVRQIRAMAAPKCSVPIIALTADAMAGAREQYLAAGMDDYLSKPIQPRELMARLARIGEEMEQAEPLTAADDSLDLAALAELARIMSPADMQGLIGGYVDGAEARLRQLRDASEAGDLLALQPAAHDRVAEAAYVGAGKVSEAARALERACAENAPAGEIAACVGRVARTTTQAVAALRRWLQTEGVGLRM
jgi:CheY-like chemotaxis protein/HPt (histidine-containing phosphotransfer) domain-containing protein